jgi:ABC-type Fe3+/spermidine/putrescine transport system ATPase subunit/ubiquinone/menaquinone biosynthesis C-methylase UbiE
MHAGELVVVLGNSGTGKSTLLDVIAGFTRPSMNRISRRTGAWLAPRSPQVEMEGEIFMDGQSVTHLEPRYRDVGLVMQRFNLYPHMKVRQNLDFPLKMRGIPDNLREKLIEERAQSLDISEHLEKAPNQLSVGEQQRVAIAKMLLCQPRIALFDEAFSNLNWELRDYLYETVVKDFVANGEKGVVFVSHNLLDAIEATRILYMQRDKNAEGTKITEFPESEGNAWIEFENFLMADSQQYQGHRKRYAQVFARETEARKQSAFGHAVYSPIEVLSDQPLSDVLKPTFIDICAELGVQSFEAHRLAEKIWAKNVPPLLEFEDQLQRDINSIVPEGRLQSALERRSIRIAEEVKPFLVGDTLADIGCGDGIVAWHLQRFARKILLTDVEEYLDPRITFPFSGYTEGHPLPLDESMDTSLLLTVLHHAEDPLRLLRETKRITKTRVIVIESVFGVSKDKEKPKSILRSLTIERQLKYQTFLDWLYNRVFHDGVPVPYNFNTPEAWRKIFEEMGWEIEQMIDLGVDQPIVPEHHFLFVLNTPKD